MTQECCCRVMEGRGEEGEGGRGRARGRERRVETRTPIEENPIKNNRTI